MKLATKLRKKVILETYRKDFPNIDFNDFSSSLTLYDNGRIGMSYDDSIKFGKTEASKQYVQFGIGTFTHKTLIGINDNNGWILIEPDGSNLPNDNNSMYHLGYMSYDNKFIKLKSTVYYQRVKDYFLKHRITHYKPIKEELKPIY